MDQQAAEFVLAGITAVGTVVWVTALRFLIVSARTRPAGSAGDEGGPADEWPTGWLSGGAEVDGDAAELSTRAAALLAKGAALPGASLKIVEKADRLIRFEGTGVGRGSRSQGWSLRGELRFAPAAGGRTRVAWGAEPVRMRWLLWLGAAFLAAGLVALVALCSLLGTLVVSSPNPAVRWQVFQMVQAFHFVWPPFLFGGLYRLGRRGMASQLEAFVHNLPYAAG